MCISFYSIKCSVLEYVLSSMPSHLTGWQMLTSILIILNAVINRGILKHVMQHDQKGHAVQNLLQQVQRRPPSQLLSRLRGLLHLQHYVMRQLFIGTHPRISESVQTGEWIRKISYKHLLNNLVNSTHGWMLSLNYDSSWDEPPSMEVYLHTTIESCCNAFFEQWDKACIIEDVCTLPIGTKPTARPTTEKLPCKSAKWHPSEDLSTCTNSFGECVELDVTAHCCNCLVSNQRGNILLTIRISWRLGWCFEYILSARHSRKLLSNVLLWLGEKLWNWRHMCPRWQPICTKKSYS